MRLNIKLSKKWIIIIALIALFLAYIILDGSIRPTIVSLAEAKLQAIAVKAMNDAVRATIGTSKLTYSDLIHIEKDDAGKISLITANTVLMNELAADTATAAQNNILNVGQQGISIPIGTIFGGQLLTGRGPSIVIKFEPVGSVTTDFRTEFENAGINQTRHKIYLVLTATVRILVGNAAQTVEVLTKVLISETIIVGAVPQTYLQLDGVANGLLNLLPSSKSQ